jgi:spermidine synthase
VTTPARARASTDSTHDPRNRRRLGVTVFVVGAASLGTEIAAARLLAPYFGASTIVWANTIATVLLALSAGYALGGRLADRHPSHRTLGGVILVASVLLAAVPYVAPPFLTAASRALNSVSVQLFLGSLGGVLVLCAVPLVLLGTVAPLALRLSLEHVRGSGRVSGRLYALSTLGSLVGTFLAALLLIPGVGTRATFVGFALALAVVGTLNLPHGWPAIVCLLALIALAPGADSRHVADGLVLYEADTVYQHVRVIERADGERWLELNEGQAVHSLLRPGSFLTGNYWDDPLVLALAARGKPPDRVAILGDAAGTTARAFGHYFPAAAVDAVELDGQLTTIGRRYFDLGGPRLHTITADARPFLRAPGPRYDAIEVDAYRQPYIPFYLTTREFFAEVAQRLRPDGVIMVNVGHPPGSTELERVVTAGVASALPHVLRDRVDDTNVFVVGSRAPLAPSRITAATAALDPGLRPLASDVAARLSPPMAPGQLFTDDRAPVEWLIDESLLRYATVHP